MSSDPQSDNRPQGSNGQPADNDGEQTFTKEELRKAARAQVILYIVMAVFIALPFVVMWLRKG